MKKSIVCFLIACGTICASTHKEDLKVIVENTFMNSACDPLLNMLAHEAITESKKKISSEQLVEQFRKDMGDEKTVTKLMAPYTANFSEDEIKELRKLQENPIWKKLNQQGASIFQAQMEGVKETFKDLALNFKADVKEEIAINLAVLQATQKNFNQITESKIPVIIDVNASWCGACKMLAPVFDEVSEKYKGKILFAKLDIDSQNALADQYGVTALPTLVFLKPGQNTPVMTNVGFISKKDLEAKIDEFLKKQ